MKKKFWLKSSALGLLISGSLLASTVSADQAPIQILGINDFHGALNTTGSAYMPEGRISGAGSAAVLSTYLKNAENEFLAANPNGVSLRVQAGDMVGASPANSGLLQDEPTIVFSMLWALTMVHLVTMNLTKVFQNFIGFSMARLRPQVNFMIS